MVSLRIFQFLNLTEKFRNWDSFFTLHGLVLIVCRFIDAGIFNLRLTEFIASESCVVIQRLLFDCGVIIVWQSVSLGHTHIYLVTIIFFTGLVRFKHKILVVSCHLWQVLLVECLWLLVIFCGAFWEHMWNRAAFLSERITCRTSISLAFS